MRDNFRHILHAKIYQTLAQLFVPYNCDFKILSGLARVNLQELTNTRCWRPLKSYLLVGRYDHFSDTKCALMVRKINKINWFVVSRVLTR